MNRFRTKKKGKDDSSAPRSSQDEPSSSFRFRKAKKPLVEPKPELDLATALPASEDFRTSLLMTGLSARFSMLREQDDPNTKIGKASDDSVLFPKRQSRLADFNAFRGLSDIAEVESIRAPFARLESFNSSDGDSTHGSIMTRAKPNEGNNLFGGRQKIYKIPAGSAVSGGMGGRALYDDDVAMSAFQKWKRAEKDRKSLEDEREGVSGRPSTEEPEGRSESPYSGTYNRNRETSSTTSSVPSMPRNSTAATSVTSQQPTPSLKDWQSSSTAPTSTSSTPALERSFTRTRRLYENGLNQELHEQQSSALSRIDTLTRRGTRGSRTPDLGQSSPSPTAHGFAERFGSERRIMAKASAPNLRSMSPPMSASSAGKPDLGIRVPSAGDTRNNLAGAPPLSPPIIEAEEIGALPIQPNDRGKATALGVFQKPAQPYDESRYAQRQMQLQQGRETPTQRFRTDSNASFTTGRSRSSSAHRHQYEPNIDLTSLNTHHALKEEVVSPTFLSDDSEASPVIPSPPAFAPNRMPRRPSDREHPAFRGLALPMPPNAQPPPTVDFSSAFPTNAEPCPVDSPTLGPTISSSGGASAGLSGMVRQHLRADSGASSIYGASPASAVMDSRFPLNPHFPVEPADSKALHDYGATSDPWELQDQDRDWSPSYYGLESSPDKRGRSTATGRADKDESDMNTSQPEDLRETDEFASQLADGARRVRERLTTYVETDSRSTSPHPLNENRNLLNAQPIPRPQGLGLLKSMSSRGSLVDRNRDTASQSKAIKMLGRNGPEISPNPGKYSFDEPNGLASMKEVSPRKTSGEVDQEAEGEEHAGIRAFRQARRELQRLKETELQQKLQQHAQAPLSDEPTPRTTPTQERATRQRTPSRERKPPPIFYQQRAPSEESQRADSRSGSRAPPQADRNRSGSTSSAERSQSRPPPMRLRNGSSPPESGQLGVNGNARTTLRFPGLPGTDIRRSPIMPPQGYPGGAPVRANQGNYRSNGSLHVNHHRGYDSNQSSPVSPMPSLFGSAPTTPNDLPSPLRPLAPPTPGVNADGSEVPGLSDAMKRSVKKREISEPTFVMSTSRVPTVALPPQAAVNRPRSNSRSRSNSKAEPHTAPPLPAINPRRRQENSKTRTVFGSMVGRRDTSDEGLAAPVLARNATTPDFHEESKSTFSNSDDDELKPRRLRKMASDAQGMPGRMRGPAPSQVYHTGPPASRMVVTQGLNDRSKGMPGGMI